MATYDIEALREDLPNAKDLAQFVFDRTGIALDLIGKPKDEQYQVAKNALEGKKVPSEFVTDDNPYMDRKEIIPEDPLAPMPGRVDGLPPEESRVHYFGATNMPHPDDPQSDRKHHQIALAISVLLQRFCSYRNSTAMCHIDNLQGMKPTRHCFAQQEPRDHLSG